MWIIGRLGMLVGFASFLVVTAAAVESRRADDGHRLLSNSEMASVVGSGPECQWGYINYDLPSQECQSGGPFNNDCANQGCVNAPNSCDADGSLYSGNMPNWYEIWAVGNCDETLKTDRSVGCHYDVDCNQGALQTTRNCSNRQCKVPVPGAPVHGCRTCSLGQEHPVTLTSLVDPYYDDCTCASEEQ